MLVSLVLDKRFKLRVSRECVSVSGGHCQPTTKTWVQSEVWVT